ncbi:WD40 repeat domain-containing protein [Streptomyces sp. NPDC059456]|uniref:WD40 repeat domain-containing protein n=1 Tax=Streptomyces sp. NPDC059456 TaxID=3346838 RepID=UPI0036CDE15E
MDQQARSGASIAFAFAPDGKSPAGQVVTKDEANTLTFWALHTPRGFRPYIRLWDARTLRPKGQDLSTGPVWTCLSAPATATAVSPDGRLFATVHASRPGHQIEVWDSRTRTRLGVPLTGAVDEVVVVAFTPDGSAVTGADNHDGVFTHPLAPGQLVRDLCALSGPLGEQEWKTHIPDVPHRKTC